MPTVKLNSGTFSRVENGKKVRYKAGDVVENVSEKLSRTLRCSIVPAEAEPKDLDTLRAEAVAAGISIKPTWTAAKLEKELAAHGNANRS